MLSTFRQADLLWPTLLSVTALAVLIGLGTWQWQRKLWKEGLIEQLAQSAEAAPQKLADVDLRIGHDALRFKRVRVAGQFAASGQQIEEFHLWTPDQSGPGWRVISPFRFEQPVTVGGEKRHWALVIRGRVSQADKDASQRVQGQVRGLISLVGRLRFAETNWATPKPNLTANEWYGLDLDLMRATIEDREQDARSKGMLSSQALPFFIEAENALAPAPAPQPDLKAVHLRNRHLEYAITWWGLALTLVAVYLAFARGRLQRRARTDAAA